jgi:hypothetical protein
MVMLPLAAALGSRRGDVTAHIELTGEIRADAQTLTLVLARSGAACGELRELDAIRERLAVLYGAKAKLDLDRRRFDRTVATLELPYAAT